MTDVRIIVPRRADHGWRDQLWEYTRAHWAQLGWPISEGFDSGVGPFNRSRAINAGAMGEWDVAVIIDADTIMSLDRVRSAVAHHLEPDRLLLPFGIGRRMMVDEVTTLRMVIGEPEYRSFPFDPSDAKHTTGMRMSHAVADPYRGFRSGVVIVHRDLWGAVGGFDERFVGWSAEDDAMADACEAIGAGSEKRLDGEIWHLWHEDARPALDDSNYRANQALWRRYRVAKRRRALMESIISEPGRRSRDA